MALGFSSDEDGHRDGFVGGYQGLFVLGLCVTGEIFKDVVSSFLILLACLLNVSNESREFTGNSHACKMSYYLLDIRMHWVT